MSAFVLHNDPFTPYDEVPSNQERPEIPGFRAEMLPQVVGDEFRHRIGTKPLDLADWFPSDSETEPTIAMKRRLIAERRAEVVAMFEGGEAVAHEAGHFVSSWAGKENSMTGVDALVEAAMLIADDLTVLEPRTQSGKQQLIFVAGVVCSPSRWKLNDKMGKDMFAVHVPVPKYAEHIGAGVNSAMERMTVNRPIWRSNWTLEDHPALFQPFAPPRPLVESPQDLWVRLERETLVRLPRTNGVIFSIRGYQQPLLRYVQQSREIANTLLTLIQRLPDDVARYKSIYDYRSSLLDWLPQFC